MVILGQSLLLVICKKERTPKLHLMQVKTITEKDRKLTMTAFRVLLLFIISISVLLFGCRQHGPTRPAGVPVAAVWAGGADGGAFFNCAPSQNGGPNLCTVYSDSTGAIYMSGKFILQGQARGARSDELKYASADGKRIYLEHNLVLTPISD